MERFDLFTRNEDMYTYAGCETSSLTRYWQCHRTSNSGAMWSPLFPPYMDLQHPKRPSVLHVSLIIQMRVHYPYGSLPVFIPILSWIVPFSLLENACSLIILWTDRANSAISITCLLLLRCGKPLTKKTCMISKRVQQRAEHLHIDNKIRNIRKWKLIENLRLWSL